MPPGSLPLDAIAPLIQAETVKRLLQAGRRPGPFLRELFVGLASVWCDLLRDERAEASAALARTLASLLGSELGSKGLDPTRAGAGSPRAALLSLALLCDAVLAVDLVASAPPGTVAACADLESVLAIAAGRKDRSAALVADAIARLRAQPPAPGAGPAEAASARAAERGLAELLGEGTSAAAGRPALALVGLCAPLAGGAAASWPDAASVSAVAVLRRAADEEARAEQRAAGAAEPGLVSGSEEEAALKAARHAPALVSAVAVAVSRGARASMVDSAVKTAACAVEALARIADRRLGAPRGRGGAGSGVAGIEEEAGRAGGGAAAGSARGVIQVLEDLGSAASEEWWSSDPRGWVQCLESALRRFRAGRKAAGVAGPGRTAPSASSASAAGGAGRPASVGGGVGGGGWAAAAAAGRAGRPMRRVMSAKDALRAPAAGSTGAGGARGPRTRAAATAAATAAARTATDVRAAVRAASERERRPAHGPAPGARDARARGPGPASGAAAAGADEVALPESLDGFDFVAIVADAGPFGKASAEPDAVPDYEDVVASRAAAPAGDRRRPLSTGHFNALARGLGAVSRAWSAAADGRFPFSRLPPPPRPVPGPVALGPAGERCVDVLRSYVRNAAIKAVRSAAAGAVAALLASPAALAPRVLRPLLDDALAAMADTSSSLDPQCGAILAAATARAGPGFALARIAAALSPSGSTVQSRGRDAVRNEEDPAFAKASAEPPLLPPAEAEASGEEAGAAGPTGSAGSAGPSLLFSGRLVRPAPLAPRLQVRLLGWASGALARLPEGAAGEEVLLVLARAAVASLEDRAEEVRDAAASCLGSALDLIRTKEAVRELMEGVDLLKASRLAATGTAAGDGGGGAGPGREGAALPLPLRVPSLRSLCERQLQAMVITGAWDTGGDGGGEEAEDEVERGAAAGRGPPAGAAGSPPRPRQGRGGATAPPPLPPSPSSVLRSARGILRSAASTGLAGAAASSPADGVAMANTLALLGMAPELQAYRLQVTCLLYLRAHEKALAASGLLDDAPPAAADVLRAHRIPSKRSRTSFREHRSGLRRAAASPADPTAFAPALRGAWAVRAGQRGLVLYFLRNRRAVLPRLYRAVDGGFGPSARDTDDAQPPRRGDAPAAAARPSKRSPATPRRTPSFLLPRAPATSSSPVGGGRRAPAPSPPPPAAPDHASRFSCATVPLPFLRHVIGGTLPASGGRRAEPIPAGTAPPLGPDECLAVLCAWGRPLRASASAVDTAELAAVVALVDAAKCSKRCLAWARRVCPEVFRHVDACAVFDVASV